MKSSLVPLAERQQYAVLWMEDYFDKYGDQSPNSEETQLCIMHKSDVYKKYFHEMSNANPPREHVDYSLFNSLWNTIHPKSRSRPWCDIPGKCDTCFEIDSARRKSDDSIVQEMLQQAHHLHRGGLFMQERSAYDL